MNLTVTKNPELEIVFFVVLGIILLGILVKAGILHYLRLVRKCEILKDEIAHLQKYSKNLLLFIQSTVTGNNHLLRIFSNIKTETNTDRVILFGYNYASELLVRRQKEWGINISCIIENNEARREELKKKNYPIQLKSFEEQKHEWSANETVIICVLHDAKYSIRKSLRENVNQNINIYFLDELIRKEMDSG